LVDWVKLTAAKFTPFAVAHLLSRPRRRQNSDVNRPGLIGGSNS
jgi:hypothetical protein